MLEHVKKVERVEKVEQQLAFIKTGKLRQAGVTLPTEFPFK